MQKIRALLNLFKNRSALNISKNFRRNQKKTFKLQVFAIKKKTEPSEEANLFQSTPRQVAGSRDMINRLSGRYDIDNHYFVWHNFHINMKVGLERGRAVSFLEIFVSNFRYSVFAVRVVGMCRISIYCRELLTPLK
jgi:hypothetical protein